MVLSWFLLKQFCHNVSLKVYLSTQAIIVTKVNSMWVLNSPVTKKNNYKSLNNDDDDDDDDSNNNNNNNNNYNNQSSHNKSP